MTNLKMIGEKVAVTQAKEELRGSIILPENRMIKFEIGKVLAVGDGKYRDGTSRTMWVTPGDIVMYQLGGPQIENSKFKLRDKTPIKIFHQGDIIAKLTPVSPGSDSVLVGMDTFNIIGNWVLLEVKFEQGTIIVPEKVAPSEEFKFIVKQKGLGVELPIEIGQEVYPERGKCLPVEIEGITYVYTHQDFLHGAIQDLKVSDPVIEDAVPSPTEERASA